MADEQATPQMPSTDDVVNALHSIFLAGVGAIAASTEKGSELFKSLVDKGQSTVDAGKAKSAELVQNAQSKVEGTTHDAIRAYLAKLTPEQRASFVAAVQKAADDAEAASQKTADAAESVADRVATEAVALDVEPEVTEDDEA